MPKLGSNTPSYRRHKPTGQAMVALDGRYFYLGPYGSKASKIEYDRLIGEWLANGRRLPQSQQQFTLAVVEIVAAFVLHAKKHYRKPDGTKTSELDQVKQAMRHLNELYADTPAAEFGPLALKAVRDRMIAKNISRGVINAHAGRIKRMFRWAVANEMAPLSTYHGLTAVMGLQEGRCDARECPPVEPVDDVTVEATLAKMQTIAADMVRLQRLTGARPDEVCMLRPCDVDTTGEVWRYSPPHHKTSHRGRVRAIFIGPQAQDVLRRYLLRDKEAYCFVPAESESKRNTERRENRQSPMTPSQAARTPKAKRGRAPGDRYTTASYRRAIHRACDVAFPPSEGLDEVQVKQWQHNHRWSPNRLRHTAATEIRKRFGIEGAQVALGHASANITQVYAERDHALAARIMKEVG